MSVSEVLHLIKDNQSKVSTLEQQVIKLQANAGGVSSFKTRVGDITPTFGDYNSSLVEHNADTLENKLNSMDTEINNLTQTVADNDDKVKYQEDSYTTSSVGTETFPIDAPNTYKFQHSEVCIIDPTGLSEEPLNNNMVYAQGGLNENLRWLYSADRTQLAVSRLIGNTGITYKVYSTFIKI